MKMLHASANPRSFLLATFEGGGSVGPVIVVAQKLLARGHKVRVMSDEANRGDAESVGAEFVPWSRAPNRADRSRYSDPTKDWEAQGPDQLKRWIDYAFAGPALLYAQDVIEELEREPADLVIGSELILGIGLGCEAIGQPHALLACCPLFYPVQGATPMGIGLRPAHSDEERAQHAQASAMIHDLFDHGLPALNAAREALGLAPLAHALDQTWQADRVLVASSPAFDFNAPAMPDKVSYVGPQLGSACWAKPWVSPWADDDTRPLVVVGFSTTFQDHAEVLQRIMNAAADLPVRVLVTLGGSIEDHEVVAPHNAVVAHSAPHDVVMREAALVVTHGGHGTVMRALVHQKPILVLPHGRDQTDNGARVEEQGAGLMLHAGASVEQIRDSLRILLNDPQFVLAAQTLGEKVCADAAQSRVVEELEALAHQSSASGSEIRCA
ncbi:MAG: glycosyltransferase [Caulobacterales bacterium]